LKRNVKEPMEPRRVSTEDALTQWCCTLRRRSSQTKRNGLGHCFNEATKTQSIHRTHAT
ncbi:hypothetical protein ABEB36_003699, partial [Hypothenemus hampei]